MTVKESLIRQIQDMDESSLADLQEYVNRLLWENIPKEEPTEEEREIFEKYKNGDEEYACVYTMAEIIEDRKKSSTK